MRIKYDKPVLTPLKGGRPKGIPCKWKGKRLPWKPRARKPGTKIFTDKMKKWADTYMETGSLIDASIVAYDLDNTPAHRKYASVLSSTNKKHPLIVRYMEDVATIASNSIMHLAQAAENERVKLSASQDILDRLGYKAPEKIEIDDRRELSEDDRAAIDKVQSILSGSTVVVPKLADIEDEQPDTLGGVEDALGNEPGREA